MQTQKTKSSAKPRRTGKVLSDALYAYCEPANSKYARNQGAKLFGSFSAYVNALIANDRGVKPKLGIWRAKGENELTKTAGAKTVVKKNTVKSKAKKTSKAKKVTHH